MKILVIGGGGREHALVWSLLQSASPATEIVCAPVDTSNLHALINLVVIEQPALTVIGPEVPLALGLVDELQRRSLRVFGPTKDAAQLESSKAFAKSFMQRHDIPTAANENRLVQLVTSRRCEADSASGPECREPDVIQLLSVPALPPVQHAQSPARNLSR